MQRTMRSSRPFASGFRISAGILAATLVVAIVLLPRRMRTAQAGFEAEAGGDGAAEEGTVVIRTTDAEVGPAEEVA